MTTRADLEKRLAEAFREVMLVKKGFFNPQEECARIAAEEIEKAARSAYAEAVHQAAVQMPNMTIRDQDAVFAQMPAALARIIGADGHEGGDATVSVSDSRTRDGAHVDEEVSGPSPQYGRDKRAQAAEGSGTTIGHPAQAAEPPRPHPNLFPGPERILERLAYEYGRAEAYRECARLCEAIADEAITLNPLHCAARIRAAAREGTA